MSACGKPRRQGHVEPKLLHHVRIAPLRKQRLLPSSDLTLRRRARSASEAGARNRSSSRTQARATLRTACISPCGVSARKPPKVVNANPLHMAGARLQQGQMRRLPKLSHLPFSQTKRRLQSRVKPVFARCHRDVIQTGQIRLGCLTAMQNIPTEPRRAEIGQGPIRRHIVNCKSRV